MATMTYCAVENTAADLAIVLETTEDFTDAKDWFDDRNQYEQRNVSRLRQLCQDFLDFTDSLED